MILRRGMLSIVGLSVLMFSNAQARPHSAHHGHHVHHGHRAQGMRPQSGIASYYAQRFHGRTMADGGVFLVGSNSAASLTLPLGTVARVTNRENHRTQVVVIRDRGPYAHHRIIDLSPATARKLGFTHDDLAPVTVSPLRMASGYGRRSSR